MYDRLRTPGRGIALLFAAAFLLPAANITFNPAATTLAGPSACGNYPGYSCWTTAYFDSGTLFDQDDTELPSLFTTAFNNFNTANGGDWTLENGGALAGTYNITTATAQQFTGVTLGGLTINIDVSGLTLPTIGANQQLVWVQGLYINYTPGPGTIVDPYYSMDTSTLSNLTCGGMTKVFCPPAYPYQYNDDSFYDQPKDYYMPPGTTQAFFDADAYLAVEDFTNANAPVLTVYDGISYGFQNFVSPEPGTFLLLGGGFGILLLRRRRIAD
jgi:hypothetical protein